MGGLTIEFEGFLWSRLCEQAEAEQVEVEELIHHAVAYYLADLDAGRAAARPLRTDLVSGGSARAARRPGGFPGA